MATLKELLTALGTNLEEMEKNQYDPFYDEVEQVIMEAYEFYVDEDAEGQCRDLLNKIIGLCQHHLGNLED